MADKRISQLVERVNIANNDVLPIVASGATTTNKVTVSTLQDWMQSNLDVGVTSVGLSMPSAFVVSNSPVTGSGNISVTGAGTVSQYIRGDGSLADFPSGGGGGGSSVNYYLNGSVSQGTIGGIAYQEMNRTPILGAGTDFTIAADGYIASFITDAGDPALLEIPAGNWNFETYLQASSGGGTPSFYIELYKVNSGGTATLIASNSGSPELIAFGTAINPYFSALAVPTTSLTLTDRLALRYYVTHSGRTITLHTENTTLCQIVTTFTTGLTALNGLTAQVQNFATGTSGTDFAISSSVNTHTFNLPTASATNRGALSSADWTTFNNKQNAGNYVTTDTTQSISGVKTFTGGALRISSGGLGGLPTRIVNAPVSSVALSGFNSIGFNGSNNLFITRETDTNGVILAFNNTDLRTYTLPNVSGTIALTSDLSSGYVPYSGAAANVDLGVYNLTASAIIANGSGSNSGIIHLESNAFHSLIHGYGSISSGTTNQFNLYQTTGAGVFRCAILSLNSITASATRTYTLPDADGTIALTSSLSGYLPLAGGTLTGALNGTSASFTGAVTNQVTNISADGAGVVLQGYVDNTLRIAVRGSGYNSGARGGLIAGTGDFSGALNGTSAVFSGNINIQKNGSGTVGSGPYYTLYNAATTDGMLWQLNASNNIDFWGLTSNSFTASPVITLTRAGAATFSSSVGVGAAPTNGKLEVQQSTTTAALWVQTGGTSSSHVIADFRTGTNLPALQILGNGTATFGSSVTLQNAGELRTYRSDNTRYGSFFTDNLAVHLTSSNDPIRISSADRTEFYNAGSERMRITSGGYLKASNNGNYVNATASYHELNNNSDARVAILTNRSTTLTGQNGIMVYFNNAAPNNTTSSFIACEDSSNLKFIVYSNGNVQNTNNSYGAISDAKLKENIEDASPKLDDLMKVKVRNYNLIGDDKKQIGVIAQELEEVFPAMIDESEDFEEVEVPHVDEEGNEILNEEGEVVTTKERVSKGTTTKSVKYSVFVPMLIKAMQEQQEQIKELKTEIDSLKNQMQ